MDLKKKAVKKIKTFLVITLVLSTPLYFLIIRSGSIQTNGGILTLALMWAPGVSGIITQLIHEHTLRGMGWKLGKAKYLLLAYCIPVIYCLIVYGITWISGLGGVPNPEFMAGLKEGFGPSSTMSPWMQVLAYSGSMATIGVLSGLVSGAGEEIGWRGVFVPELAKVTTFTKTTFISGAIWTLWHLPLILFADYTMPGIPKWYAVIMFTIMVLGINTVFSWLRLKSGSLWTAALLHASHNLFVQNLFTPLTAQHKITPFIIDEFGVGLALAGIVLMIIFIRKGKKLGLPLIEPVAK